MFDGFISIDYAAAILKAKNLENAAEECAEISQKITKQLSYIEGVWEGAASDAFKQKLTEYQTENQKTQSELRSVARDIRIAAEAIKQADEAAASVIGS